MKIKEYEISIPDPDKQSKLKQIRNLSIVFGVISGILTAAAGMAAPFFLSVESLLSLLLLIGYFAIIICLTVRLLHGISWSNTILRGIAAFITWLVISGLMLIILPDGLDKSLLGSPFGFLALTLSFGFSVSGAIKNEGLIKTKNKKSNNKRKGRKH